MQNEKSNERVARVADRVREAQRAERRSSRHPDADIRPAVSVLRNGDWVRVVRPYGGIDWSAPVIHTLVVAHEETGRELTVHVSAATRHRIGTVLTLHGKADPVGCRMALRIRDLRYPVHQWDVYPNPDWTLPSAEERP